MSDQKKVVVVFGATGIQGGSVIKSILEDPQAKEQFKLRGITRDPSKPNAKALAEKGVECVTVSSYDMIFQVKRTRCFCAIVILFFYKKERKTKSFAMHREI